MENSPPQTIPQPQQQQQSSSFSLESLNPSIFITIIIIASTIILSISLCYLLRHLRRKHHHSSAVNPQHEPPANATTRTRSFDDTNNALLNSLPSFTFSSVMRKSQNDVVGDCAVCLTKFEEQDMLRLLPLCCHAFHVECIDTWLMNNESCPICRAGVRLTESDLLKALNNGGGNGNGNGSGSFRLELGSVSRRRELGLNSGEFQNRHSYSIGSFDYIVQDDGEVEVGRKDEMGFPATATVPTVEESLAGEVGGGGRTWLKEYVDRLSASISSRTASFRSSGRFFTGSSRRTDVLSVGDYDLEANSRIGDEISEFFRWFSAM